MFSFSKYVSDCFCCRSVQSPTTLVVSNIHRFQTTQGEKHGFAEYNLNEFNCVLNLETKRLLSFFLFVRY